MAGRLTRARAASAIRERIERPEAIALAVLLAIIAAVGWLSTGPVLAVSVALSLAIGGFGAIYLLGPAQQGLGLGRYMTMALAAAALTLFGRSLPGGVVLLLGPIAAVLLWSVIWLEMRVARAGGGFRLGIDLILVGPSVDVLRAGINAVRFEGAAASDHEPVQAVIRAPDARSGGPPGRRA